jgi:multisubunit Na+/H+ antiporter MnhB subunit
MNNAIGLAIFALGVILLIFGFNESYNPGSEISRLFTGSAGERPVWLIVGGALAVLTGLAVAIAGARRSTEQ